MRYFLGVGAQKAGTSWLHLQLSLHPEVAMAPRKEVHYFDTMFPSRGSATFGVHLAQQLQLSIARGNTERANRIANRLEVFFRGPEAYRAFLETDADEHSRIVGEITPGYATLTRDGFVAMKSTLDPLILFVMRDPLERYWSQIRQLRHADAPRTENARFGTAIRDDAAIWARSDYRATLELLDDVFPPEQVRVLFYEHMFTEESLAAIATFLGVAPRWPWNLQARVNAGDSREMPEPPASLIERFLPVYEYVRDRFGAEVPETWRVLTRD